ncbi:MAG: tagatose 1,6-diphosphate aldolase [Fusobacterium sp.]|nr:tagatose 1,6-diphosphate aldolase [Fusobacterium sp.]
MTKKDYLKKLSNKDNIIAALAIDQRGAIRRMITTLDDETRDQKIREFKALVSKDLTKYSSSILLDPIYGQKAIKEKDGNCGLIMAYEITGYDTAGTERFPRLIQGQSVLRLKEAGADAIKILLYYDVDQAEEINDVKKAFVERIGNECRALDLPFFLEIVSYDANITDSKSKEFAKVKPHKVNGAIKDFTDDRYNIDVLKLEVPVNMNFVEGFGEETVYTKEEAMKYFKEQSDLCKVPFIFLSAGVSNKMFRDTLYFAKEAGSKFNGVLCGRATWAGGVAEFINSEEAGKKWLNTVGIENIENINKALAETATPWE